MIALPRGHRAVALALVALALAACSQADGSASSTPPAPLGSPTASAEPSASPSATAAQPVDVALAESWTAVPASDGAGYVLDLEETGQLGVYDGRLYHRGADGAVTGQNVVTVTVTAPDSVDVRWPDQTVTPGRLTLATGGSVRTELALDPGCLAYLVDGASQLDCRLYPADEFAPVASASPSAEASSSPSPSASAATQPEPTPTFDLPDSDEALGYLCSISDPTRLDHVTGDPSDPYLTAVLQGALVAVGFDPGKSDGRFRPKTRRAVRDFQSAAGLVPDGLVGPRTWTALQAAACTLGEDPAER